MRTTIDTYTGKPFRYNDTDTIVGGVRTVARYTTTTSVYLHPDRLSPRMRARLNPQEPKTSPDR